MFRYSIIIDSVSDKSWIYGGCWNGVQHSVRLTNPRGLVMMALLRIRDESRFDGTEMSIHLKSHQVSVL